jgi:outer membrane lipopolysaccharide assembly protein LptE/RlpB
MRRQTVIRRLLLMAVLLLMSACGYRLPTASMQHEGVSSYSVGIFRNAAYRVGIDTVVRRTLDEELAGRHGLVVKPAGGGDAEFTGTVVSYGTTAVSFGSDDRVREYRATLKVEVELRQRSTNQPLWKGVIVVTQDFPANMNLQLQQNSEEAAILELGRKAARQIYLRQQDNF